MKKGILFLAFLLAITIANPSVAQEKKGQLEDFAEDFEEDDDDNQRDDGAGEFFLWLFFDNVADIARLWGGTPATAFGPYPSFPYQESNGFMTDLDDRRSYFFSTEISYQHLNSDLRSYLFKWETQFAHKSKLSFDLVIYEEDLFNETIRRFEKDRLSLYGFRYGYALYRTPQMIVNLEGGYRGLNFRNHAGGPEIALDLQLFPGKPLILETELAAAYVGKSPLYTVDASAGIAVGRVEFLGGMRILKNKDQDLLDGFRFGVRVWY